ncbi:MAG: hypothetical protein LQ341_007561, partial [Variospora aurantia]
VQKLENVAIEDTNYQDGKTRSSRPAAATFSPPPTAPSVDRQVPPKSNDQETFKPLAYNPAAPPAPEPIKHREKTPPPPDAETEGTGLSAAAYNDHAHSLVVTQITILVNLTIITTIIITHSSQATSMTFTAKYIGQPKKRRNTTSRPLGANQAEDWSIQLARLIKE